MFALDSDGKRSRALMIRDDPRLTDAGEERRRAVVTNHEGARSLAVTVEGEHADIDAAGIVDQQLDGHGSPRRLQRLLLRASQYFAGRVIAVASEAHVLDISVRTQPH